MAKLKLLGYHFHHFLRRYVCS